MLKQFVRSKIILLNSVQISLSISSSSFLGVYYAICAFLDNQVGMNRLPQFKDKPNMPYTEAFIFEVFRHASYVPFTIPHW